MDTKQKYIVPTVCVIYEESGCALLAASAVDIQLYHDIEVDSDDVQY